MSASSKKLEMLDQKTLNLLYEELREAIAGIAKLFEKSAFRIDELVSSGRTTKRLDESALLLPAAMAEIVKEFIPTERGKGLFSETLLGSFKLWLNNDKDLRGTFELLFEQIAGINSIDRLFDAVKNDPIYYEFCMMCLHVVLAFNETLPLSKKSLFGRDDLRKELEKLSKNKVGKVVLSQLQPQTLKQIMSTIKRRCSRVEKEVKTHIGREIKNIGELLKKIDERMERGKQEYYEVGSENFDSTPMMNDIGQLIEKTEQKFYLVCDFGAKEEKDSNGEFRYPELLGYEQRLGQHSEDYFTIRSVTLEQDLKKYDTRSVTMTNEVVSDVQNAAALILCDVDVESSDNDEEQEAKQTEIVTNYVTKIVEHTTELEALISDVSKLQSCMGCFNQIGEEIGTIRNHKLFGFAYIYEFLSRYLQGCKDYNQLDLNHSDDAISYIVNRIDNVQNKMKDPALFTDWDHQLIDRTLSTPDGEYFPEPSENIMSKYEGAALNFNDVNTNFFESIQKLVNRLVGNEFVKSSLLSVSRIISILADKLDDTEGLTDGDHEILANFLSESRFANLKKRFDAFTRIDNFINQTGEHVLEFTTITKADIDFIVKNLSFTEEEVKRIYNDWTLVQQKADEGKNKDDFAVRRQMNREKYDEETEFEEYDDIPDDLKSTPIDKEKQKTLTRLQRLQLWKENAGKALERGKIHGRNFVKATKNTAMLVKNEARASGKAGVGKTESDGEESVKLITAAYEKEKAVFYPRLIAELKSVLIQEIDIYAERYEHFQKIQAVKENCEDVLTKLNEAKSEAFFNKENVETQLKELVVMVDEFIKMTTRWILRLIDAIARLFKISNEKLPNELVALRTAYEYKASINKVIDGKSDDAKTKDNTEEKESVLSGLDSETSDLVAAQMMRFKIHKAMPNFRAVVSGIKGSGVFGDGKTAKKRMNKILEDTDTKLEFKVAVTSS